MHSDGIDVNIDFKCKQCGNCCRINKYLPLTLDDIFLISEYLNISADDFFKEYCVEIPCGENKIPMPYLKSEGSGCAFLEDGLCSIHFVKPVICSSMPSTIFGPFQYIRSKMPPGCAIHQLKPVISLNDDKKTGENYMISMILTTAYYSAHKTFNFSLARPYIYRILLIKRNRKDIFDVINTYTKVTN
jgi:hypothetical protein